MTILAYLVIFILLLFLVKYFLIKKTNDSSLISIKEVKTINVETGDPTNYNYAMKIAYLNEGAQDVRNIPNVIFIPYELTEFDYYLYCLMNITHSDRNIYSWYNSDRGVFALSYVDTPANSIKYNYLILNDKKYENLYE